MKRGTFKRRYVEYILARYTTLKTVFTLFACARKDTFRITQITSTFSPRFEKRLFLDANVVEKEAKQRCYFSKCSFAFFHLNVLLPFCVHEV